MSRPKSDGFPYCQQDTDTFFDPKIRMLIASHGCAGYAVWDYIKMAAYREHGYYVEWDKCRDELAAADLGISINKIGLVIDYLVRRSLLSCISRTGVKVLTSHGIQKRFQRMARDSKRTYTVDREIWILSEEETLDCIQATQKPDFSGKNPDNSGKNGVNSGENTPNQRKEKKSKSNRRPRAGTHAGANAGDGDDDRTVREKEILSLCQKAIGPLDAADERMLLDAALGMEPDEVENACGIAKGYGAKTAPYLAKAIRSQKSKPGRRPRAEPAPAHDILGGGMRRVPKCPDTK